MANVNFNQKIGNRDEVIVTNVQDGNEAWDAAEKFLQEVSEKDKTADYSTGLPGGENCEPQENGSFVFKVKMYDK